MDVFKKAKSVLPHGGHGAYGSLTDGESSLGERRGSRASVIKSHLVTISSEQGEKVL